jgi:thiol-disulfide isomerase/thioredoxin
MAYTESNMLPLGFVAPDFSLLEPLTGQMLSRNEALNGQINVVAFWCNHCPYVLHIEDHVLATAAHYQPLGVQFVFISANDAANYPDDAPDKIAARAAEKYTRFPYLYDESQETARAYEAACTPDFYVFDQHHQLVYCGRYDAARPKNDLPITGSDLKTAIDALLSGHLPAPFQYPSGGCNIKWKQID